jgi:hypothetical protein
MEDWRYEPLLEAKEDQEEVKPFEVSAGAEIDDEDMLIEKVDDRILRRIFCGLSGEKI